MSVEKGLIPILPPPCRSIPVLLLAVTPLLSACGGTRGGPQISVADSAGVSILVSSGSDLSLDWTAEKVLEVPPAEDESQGFFGITDLAVLPGRRIAVLDGEAKQVILFGEGGDLLARYGREGSGPGEFQYPLELVATPEGGVYVYDMMNARFERFDPSLSPMASDPLRMSYFGGYVAFAGGFLVLPTRDFQNPEVDVLSLLAIREPDTIQIVRFARPQGGSVTFESCGMSLAGTSPIFSPRTLWTDGPEGTVAVVGTSRYEVDVYRAPGFELERRIRREVTPVRATREMARATVGDGMRVVGAMGERVCDADEVVEKQGFADEVPPIARLAISPSGEMFVQRWAPKGEGRAVDVLASDGRYLGTLEPGFPFPEAFLAPDKIVVTKEDEMDLTSLVVYRISR